MLYYYCVFLGVSSEQKLSYIFLVTDFSFILPEPLEKASAPRDPVEDKCMENDEWMEFSSI